MNIALSPESEKIIRGRVDSGQSSSAEEVLKQALIALQERDKEDGEILEKFQAKMRESIDSLDRGEFIDPEEMFARLRERARLMRQTAA